jgi:hypothetical protein
MIGAVAWQRHLSLSAGSYLSDRRRDQAESAKPAATTNIADTANTVAVITMVPMATTAGTDG